ncbi:MAG: hypothetical protein ACYC3I_02820 [Gemmataceae bacterium]
MSLAEIETAYLEWVLHEASFAKPYLKAAIQVELNRREGLADQEQNVEECDLPAVRGIIKSWYREMAKKYHPDRTLDDGACMKVVNDGYERLRDLFGVTR